MVAYEFSPEYAQLQNNMTEHMFCPTTGCPERFEVGGGYYIPGNPWKVRYQIELYKISLLLVIGCLIWEYGVTFYSEELQRWREIFKGQIVPVNVLTIFARYFIFAAAGAAVAYVWDEKAINCQAKLTILMTSLALVWIATSLIYTLRVHAMYPRPRDRKLVRIPIICVWLIGCALWIASLPGFRSAPVSQLIRQPFSSGCSPAHSPTWRAMGFGASAVFDLIILVLSLNSVSRHSSNKSRPIYKTFRYGISDRNDTAGFIILSSTITFLLSFSMNVICFFVTIFNKNVILSNIPVALAALFDFVIANRLVFHSHQWSQGKSGLLTMPPKYNERDDGFRTIAAAIAKRKVHNDPFDQFTIEQAIESHARMDAKAWNDYMQGSAPQDIRDAVTSVILRKQQSLNAETTTTKNEKDISRIPSLGDSSSNRSSQYKSTLEKEFVRMENGDDIDPSFEQKEEIELPFALNQISRSNINQEFEHFSSSPPDGWTVQAFSQESTNPQDLEWSKIV